MKFFLQFLTLVHNYKRCRNSCFHIQLVRSQGIQNYAMLPERYTPQALFKKLNLEYLTIFKNNIENIKVIFLNNRFLVDAVRAISFLTYYIYAIELLDRFSIGGWLFIWYSKHIKLARVSRVFKASRKVNKNALIVWSKLDEK